jgi:hypothetical protein
MRILIGCEESGVVRDAFLLKGHDAWSCDIIPCRRGGQHLQMDIIEAIESHGPWDIIILHPPCDALAVSGNGTYGEGKPKNGYRSAAIAWTYNLWLLARVYARVGVCLENPVGVLTSWLGKPQYIQPWQFGHGEQKKTGLWLHNLPKLIPTDIVKGREQRIWKMPPSSTRKRDRSETYTGIAKAMAEQWG